VTVNHNYLIGKNQEKSTLLIIIDNYDSFTYNLVQYLGELAAEFPVATDIKVFRNDKITIDEIRALQPDGVVISPGPWSPRRCREFP
jgi:anthranilate synthase component 2